MIDIIEEVLVGDAVLDDVIVGVPSKNELEFLMESLCALANCPGGGRILYGIGERKGFVPFRKSQIRTEQIVLSVIKDSLTPEVVVRFESCIYKGHPILAVIVEPSIIKPVCIKNQTPLRAFHRDKGQTKLLSSSLIGRMMIDSAEGSIDTAFISKPLTEEEIFSALSFSSIKTALQLADGMANSEVLKVLLEDGLLELSGKKFWVRKLAVILFKASRNISPLDIEVPRLLIIVRPAEETRWIGLSPEIGLHLPRLADASTAILQYLKAGLKEISNYSPRDERYSRIASPKSLVLPVNAVTEVIMNAACFTDFTQYKNSQPFLRVNFFGDSLNFSSQSECSLAPDRIFDKRGDCLNPVLRDWLCRIYSPAHPSEQKGLLSLLSEIEDLMLAPPEFTVELNSFNVKINLRQLSNFKETTSKQRQLACYQHSCLMAMNDKSMSNSSFRKRLRADPSTYSRCSRIIAELLRDKKLVRSSGSKSNRDAAYLPYWYRSSSV